MRRPQLALLPGRAGPSVDDHISWPRATRSAPDLGCDGAGDYSVTACIDGKEKVYGSIP